MQFIEITMSKWNVLLIMCGLLALEGTLTGCMPQGETNPVNQVNEIPGNDDVSVKTSVLCGRGRAVKAVNANGDVICGSSKLSGLIGNCFSGESAEALAISVGETDSLVLPLCSVNLNETPDDVTMGAPPTEEFSCPGRSALVGFSESGEPLCGTIVGPDLSGVSLIMPADECPMGMVAGHLSGTDYSIPLCKYESSVPRQIKLTGKKVAKFAGQANFVCAPGSVVIGFDESHGILCGSGPKQFKRKVTRYIATEFVGHVENPKCAPGYQKENLRLTTGLGRGIKLWTCERADL